MIADSNTLEISSEAFTVRKACGAFSLPAICCDHMQPESCRGRVDRSVPHVFFRQNPRVFCKQNTHSQAKNEHSCDSHTQTNFTNLARDCRLFGQLSLFWIPFIDFGNLTGLDFEDKRLKFKSSEFSVQSAERLSFQAALAPMSSL